MILWGSRTAFKWFFMAKSFGFNGTNHILVDWMMCLWYPYDTMYVRCVYCAVFFPYQYFIFGFSFSSSFLLLWQYVTYQKGLKVAKYYLFNRSDISEPQQGKGFKMENNDLAWKDQLLRRSLSWKRSLSSFYGAKT